MAMSKDDPCNHVFCSGCRSNRAKEAGIDESRGGRRNAKANEKKHDRYHEKEKPGQCGPNCVHRLDKYQNFVDPLYRVVGTHAATQCLDCGMLL